MFIAAHLFASTLGGLFGCSTQPATTDAAAPAPAHAPEVDARIPSIPYLWDPGAGDPSVSAEDGGPGFTGEGWQTRQEIFQLGIPNVPQGGTLVTDLADWPATLRQAGPNYNTLFNYMVGPLLYESLLQTDPVTLEPMPQLATHWWISPDKMTFRFRMNPKARWSDGKEVTVDDVLATYALLVDPTLQSPGHLMTFSKLHPPKKVSKYIVEVRSKDANWRNFIYFGGMQLYPAHEIGTLKGKDYLDRYQFAYTSVSGPYDIKPENIQTGTSITVTRRTDWWAEEERMYDGWYNIHNLKFVVIKDPQLRFEKIKKGELDYSAIYKAQWWAEDIPSLDPVKRGLLVARKFYTGNPFGYSGIAMNMTKPPLNDVRVRKALQHLYDRQTMIEKLFYKEYEPLTSYFQGPYANPNNPPLPYDEIGAVELLEEAGWIEKNAEGVRTKDGRELALVLSYTNALSERALTTFVDACKRAGIRVELQFYSDASGWKTFQQKEFQLFEAAWGALVYPNPETSWHSRLAHEKDNNNTVGFANARVDGLLIEYDREYDLKRRIAIIQEIDSLIYNEHPYVLAWYVPSQRVLFWNKFGMPPWGSARMGEMARQANLFNFWWVDPDKERALEAARHDGTLTMEPGRPENKYWQTWAHTVSPSSPSSPNEGAAAGQ